VPKCVAARSSAVRSSSRCFDSSWWRLTCSAGGGAVRSFWSALAVALCFRRSSCSSLLAKKSSTTRAASRVESSPTPRNIRGR
jgi:hypothetical protein